MLNSKTCSDAFVRAGGPVFGPTLLLSYGRVMQASDNEKASGELYHSALALCQLMYHSKRYDQAEKYLQEATAVDQLNHEAWYWLGEVFSNQGHNELATNCYRTALDLELTAPLQLFFVCPLISGSFFVVRCVWSCGTIVPRVCYERNAIHECANYVSF